MYDAKTCTSTEAAWLVTAKTENGTTVAFFEAHLADDEYSPNGVGWYFASHMRDDSGKWNEYDGGMYWDYENATDLEDIIGDTVPFREYSYKQIDHGVFEDICYGNDIGRERDLLGDEGFECPVFTTKEKSFQVTITETLKRTITVKANDREEALEKVRSGWKYKTHVLGADDFKDVHFTVESQVKNRRAER